jgi:hypothetical protein
VEVIVGGQNLRQVDAVRVSGTGVEATVVKTYRTSRNLDGDQRALLKWRIACRHAEIDGRPKPPAPPPPKPNPDGTPAAEVVLPEHPMLDLLDQLNAAEVTHWMTVQHQGGGQRGTRDARVPPGGSTRVEQSTAIRNRHLEGGRGA